MAYGDLAPWIPSQWDMMHFPLDAAAAIMKGDPVALAASGELQLAADPVVVVATSGIVGISAAIADTTAAPTGYAEVGNFRSRGFGSFAPASAAATGDSVPVWVPKQVGALVLGRFTNGGTAFDTPVQTDVGDPVGIEKITAGNWAFSNHATPEKLGRIMDVLDVNLNPIRISGGTGVYILAALIITELTSGAVASFAVPAAVAD